MTFILQTTRKMGFSAFILGVCLFCTQTAFSQTASWDGGAMTTAWSDALNWSNDLVPVAASVLTIGEGRNVVISSGTNAVCRKLTINGSQITGQGKLTVTGTGTLTITSTTASTTPPLDINGGILENNGTAVLPSAAVTVIGRENIDAIRFGNATGSGTPFPNSTYMGTGSLICSTDGAVSTGSGAPTTGGNNGACVNFGQTNGTATFTVGGTYTFTTAATGTKSVFYCPKGIAKIDGTGTITTGGGVRSIRVIPNAVNETPNLTIESGVTMNLSTTILTVSIGMILLDHSTVTGASVNMTNKGTLNFSGDIGHPIYMTNPTTAGNTTNFTNEGTININGTFADATVTGTPPNTTAVTSGGIAMFGSNTTLGNVFTNSGFINFNTPLPSPGGGTSTKPLFIASTSPKNLITNSGTITVGTNGTPAIAIRLGDTKTTLNNTGTITVGAGSITGGTTSSNATFNNNGIGVLNLNSAAVNNNVTFKYAATQTLASLIVNGGAVEVADGVTLTITALTLTSGHVTLGTGNLVAGTISGGSLASHVITNSTGTLTQSVTTLGALFPIGQSASSYDPVVIKPASTLSFGARVGLQTTALGTRPTNNGLVVDREWDITGTAGTTDLAFSSSALNKDGSSTRPAGSVGVIGHHNGTTWDADIAAVYNSMTSSWSVAAYAGGFSPFIVASPGAVLSVELTNLKATPLSKINVLTWETASEISNKGFDVERQNANGTWASLGFVNGVGKASTYTFEDKDPLSISYYRLRQIDFDGKETLSKIVSVSQNTKGRISISPNPTSDKVNIQLNQNDVLNQTTTLVLSDMTGRQVLTQTTTAGAFQLDLSNLAKGMYVVTLQSNNAIYQEKIIRQ
jgi:Secretion system C-terminal sorting domain